MKIIEEDYLKLIFVSTSEKRRRKEKKNRKTKPLSKLSFLIRLFDKFKNSRY